MALAGPLTQYLNGFITQPQAQISEKIWCDAFQSDWRGDLSTLPKVRLLPRTFSKIKTRRMYEHCNEHFDRKKQALSFNFYNRESTGVDIKIPFILAAPMANLWLSKLHDLLEYPLALAHAAIDQGHLLLLQYLVEEHGVDLQNLDHYIVHRTYAMDLAAKRGNFDILKYLHHTGNNACTTIAMDEAASNGYIDIVKWLHENRAEGCTSNALDYAYGHGHMQIAEFLESHGHVQISTIAMDCAAGNGNLNVVKFLHEQRHAKCTKVAMDRAAARGHFSVVKYLHENCTASCTTKAMNGAVFGGHLEIVKYYSGPQ